MIPKIIHQTWKTSAIPSDWAGFVQSWRRHHPVWEHRLWTDADNRRLVQAQDPGFLPIYDAYPYSIQRADAVRYFILHRLGGVYVDMDVECLRPIAPLIGDRPAVLISEPPAHSLTRGRDFLISNAFMAAQPGHPFLGDILAELSASGPTAISHMDVLNSTGPIMVDRIFRHRPRPDVHLLDHRAVFPLADGSEPLRKLAEGDRTSPAIKMACLVDGAYAIHYWANSWAGLSDGQLINPDPEHVEGFVFFPRCDSFGFDLRQAGRNVADLAESCRADGGAVAFNTDGFIKSHLRPKRQWERNPHKAWNEGLYVKRSVRSSPWWTIIGTGRRAPPGA